MSPLLEHGRKTHIIANLVKVLLDYLEQDYEAFTPITMDLPEIRGIEPDYCFCINNWAAVAGKARINWGVDPSPDLVIEIDVTTYTDVNDYLPYRVPEVWIYKRKGIVIYNYREDGYEIVNNSRYFPKMNIAQILIECFQIASDRNTSAAIGELRRKLESEK